MNARVLIESSVNAAALAMLTATPIAPSPKIPATANLRLTGICSFHTLWAGSNSRNKSTPALMKPMITGARRVLMHLSGEIHAVPGGLSWHWKNRVMRRAMQ